jgi:amino acid transporter
MLVVLGILSAGLLGIIIYLALSPKSSKLLKLSAFIALGLIVIAVGICAIFLVIGPSEDTGVINFPVFDDSPPAPTRNVNIVETLIFAAIFLIIMGFIIYLGLRERRRKGMVQKPEVKKAVKTEKDPVDDLDIKPASNDDKLDIDDFDLELDLQDDK